MTAVHLFWYDYFAAPLCLCLFCSLIFLTSITFIHFCYIRPEEHTVIAPCWPKGIIYSKKKKGDMADEKIDPSGAPALPSGPPEAALPSGPPEAALPSGPTEPPEPPAQ